jgi:hypothetical protein
MNLLNEDGAPPTMRCPPRFDITRLSEPCGVRIDAPAISGRLCHLADIGGQISEVALAIHPVHFESVGPRSDPLPAGAFGSQSRPKPWRELVRHRHSQLKRRSVRS